MYLDQERHSRGGNTVTPEVFKSGVSTFKH